MKELIKITEREIGNEKINSVDARELHTFLEVKSEFRNWIKNRITQYNFAEGVDFIAGKFLPGSEQIDYYISIDMGKELGMVERNQKGKEARQYFIECEKRLKEKQNYNSDVDPVIAMAEGILAVRRKQLELEKQQVETDNRLSLVEKHLSGKVKIQDVLPDVKEKTLRNRLNEIVRSYTNEKPGREFKYIWNVLYSEFLYRNRINLKIRAGNLGVSPLDYAENAGLLKDLLALAIELFC